MPNVSMEIPEYLVSQVRDLIENTARTIKFEVTISDYVSDSIDSAVLIAGFYDYIKNKYACYTDHGEAIDTAILKTSETFSTL
jgi:hypothetical protein